jgi:conjugal transfer pilus assembly protein TraV
MNRVTLTVRLMLALVAMSGLGCATVGSGKFACPGKPEGVRCMSATEVYESTHNSDSVRATGKKAGKSGHDAKTHGGGSNSEMPNTAPSNTNGESNQPKATLAAYITPAVDKPLPVRMPATILRGWIAPWEDTGRALHVGGYVFVEIEERRWTFGESQVSTEPVRYFSIQPATVAANAKENDGKTQPEVVLQRDKTKGSVSATSVKTENTTSILSSKR